MNGISRLDSAGKFDPTCSNKQLNSLLHPIETGLCKQLISLWIKILNQDRVRELYKRLEDQKCTRGRNLDALVAASVYIACRQEGKPCTVKEIFSIANGASKKEIGRAKEFIVKQLKVEMGESMEMGTIHAGDYLEQVKLVVKKRESPKKISFLAYSHGGLIARYALAILYSSNNSNEQSSDAVNSTSSKLKPVRSLNEGLIAGLEPVNFITLATPHIGVRWKDQHSRGIKFVDRFGVDNALVRVADPTFLSKRSWEHNLVEFFS